MSKCAVVGCKSVHNPFNAAVSFHRVTRNKKYLPLWERVVKIKSKSVQAKICGLHFKEKDFVEGRGRRVLKPHAVPSFNVIERGNSSDDDDDDDDDNEKLSMLKTALTASKGVSNATEDAEKNSHSDLDDNGPNLPQNFQMVMSCCDSARSSNPLNAKQTSNMGIQTKMKTDKEISLQAKVKLLELRLRRRNTKISYMQTVLNMIKKHTKGTDMEYKLCCELQNITEPVESNIDDTIKSNYVTTWNEGEGSSGEEDACTFVEVVHSPNLRACNGF